jgi:asparagine synthase (glutamine-hydrolysing)
MNMEKIWVDKYQKILERLFKNYQNEIKEQKIGVLVSGGIDSSIVADFVVRSFSQTKLISLQSEKSIDDDFVIILAKHLKKDPLLVRVTRENLLEIQPEIKKLLTWAAVEINPVQIALGSVYYWLFKEANSQGIKAIFTGQGPDILLGGYNKYRQLSGKNLKQAILEDLPLLQIDLARDTAMAKVWDIKIINPYLDKSVIDFCLSVPTELIIKNDQEKYLSRILGKSLRLPKIIIKRPKKAMQYSTGVSKIIK